MHDLLRVLFIDLSAQQATTTQHRIEPVLATLTTLFTSSSWRPRRPTVWVLSAEAQASYPSP